MPGDGGVHPHRRVRVIDRLALQIVCRYLEERGELLGIVREADNAAVGVFQDHLVPSLLGGWRWQVGPPGLLAASPG